MLDYSMIGFYLISDATKNTMNTDYVVVNCIYLLTIALSYWLLPKTISYIIYAY